MSDRVCFSCGDELPLMVGRDEDDFTVQCEHCESYDEFREGDLYDDE